MPRIVSPALQDLPKLRQKLTFGEQLVLDLFLRELPEAWEIYIQPHLNGLRPDFVLLNPAAGIAVFEVKDWNLEAMTYYTQPNANGHVELRARRGEDDFSLQGQNPIQKVNLYKREIFELYCPRLDRDFGWAAITAGVIFPFAPREAVKKLLHPFLLTSRDEKGGDRAKRYQPLAGERELASGNILAVFPEASRRSSKMMSASLANDLRGWLVEPNFAAKQRRPIELDKNQLAFADTRVRTR